MEGAEGKVFSLVVLPGDGVGPEVIGEALSVLRCLVGHGVLQVGVWEGLICGAAIDALGVGLPEETLQRCRAADAVLFGAGGGPKWDRGAAAREMRGSLLGLRKALGVYANIRPVRVWPSLVGMIPLRADVAAGADLVIVRELTGGIYFGEPSGRMVESGERRAVDTLVYGEAEIRRVARSAFALATERRGRVTSVDKANVLSSSLLWREIVEEVRSEFPGVELEHALVDSTALRLVLEPRRYDVLVMENMFGDILSDEAGVLSGSLGMLPSASLGGVGPGLYEPVHGSAPDIAGRDRANPLGAILSLALLLRYSYALPAAAALVERAVEACLAAGYRTADIAGAGDRVVGTRAMGDQVVAALDALLAGDA